MQQQLIDYIKSQLARGYDIYTVRNYLIRYGYNPGQVDAAISAMHQAPSSSKKTMVVAAAAVLAVLIISGSLFFLLRGGAPEQLLDIKTRALSTSVYAGDSFKFNVELSNMGSKKRYDIRLRHEVLDGNGKMVAFGEETAAIETSTSKSSEVKIPDDASAGKYYLRTTASYNGEKAVATFGFTLQERVVEPSCPRSCDDSNLCTEDSCDASTGFKCAHSKIEPCCGNDICEEGEDYDSCSADCEQEETPTEQPAPVEEPEPEPTPSIGGEVNLASELSRIKEIAASSPDMAAGECAKLGKTTYTDICLTEVTKATKNGVFCGGITDTNKKDACYMNIVIDEGDYSLCEKLTNTYVKKSCESLSKLKTG